MTVQPLTPTGVDNKRTELYALTKVALLAQAAAVEADCRTWLADNFSFTTAQRTYFDNMSNDAMKYYGQILALCFRYELMITLVYPAPPAPGIGKWVEEKNTVKLYANASGDLEATGELIFTMTYRP